MLSHELMDHYAVLIVFVNVFASSLGLPLPATPTLMLAGAGIALSSDDLPSTSAQIGILVGSAVTGGALADLFWFQGGRYFGERTFKRLMPRLDVIHATGSLPERREVRMLLFARFVPGLAFISVLLCGARAVRLRSFFLHDCAGIGLWALATLIAGALFASTLIGASSAT
jgi:membrane protein DedA with SNARE-associated domain